MMYNYSGKVTIFFNKYYEEAYMSLAVQIIIGIILGLIMGFFTIISAVNKKEKELIETWNNLSKSLNTRYLKLKNVLNSLKKHMNEFQSNIEDLIKLCDKAIDEDASLESISLRLNNENTINYKLEEIKSCMQNYPSIQQDSKVNDAILAIIESETNVGKNIKAYNLKNIEYRVFLETFPISIASWVLNKNPESIIPFNVTNAREFDSSYIYEDEI